MGTSVPADPLAELWVTSQEALRGQIRVLADAAIAALEGTLSGEERDRASREAHKLAGSLASFGLIAAARQARDSEWLLQGVRELQPTDALHLSELVVGIEGEFAGGPRLTQAAAERDGAAVLVVEPDADLGRRVVEQATGVGLRPALVTSVEAARDRLAVGRPDLVLLDPADPTDPDGGRTLLEDLCLGPDPVPTLVVTAAGGKVDRAEVARVRAQGFLEKPLLPQTIVEVARNTLERRRAEFTLLVVADDAPLVATLRAALEPQGGQIDASDARLGFWQNLELASPDLLLLGSSPLEGPQLCRMVRNDPAWERLPIVSLTTSDLARELYRSGADDVLVRPVEPDELVERIANRIQRSRLRRGGDGDDPQTGLPSWPRMETELQRQLVMARRYGQPLAVAVASVDGAPELDREYGHRASHAARVNLARLLRRSFRTEDIVGARGDHHLVAGLYGAEPAGSLARLASVLETFAGMQITFEDRQFQATASAGVAMFPVDGNRVGALYTAAQAAMEAAALAGGGRVQAATAGETQRVTTVDVLVVDDDDALAPLLLHALSTQGYRVHRLRDGADAVRELLAPDGLRARVVLLDVDLPGLDGFSALRELASHGALTKLRVIMATQRAGESEVLEALELGAFDHIAKPMSIPVLLHRVRRALESLAPR